MYLKKIALLNFKNIRQEELALCPGINALVGDNGAGKTNVIDAVYYLSMCKSSLQMTDGQSIRHDADFFLIEGNYLTDACKREVIACTFSRKGGKILKRNGKEYDRLSDHVGLIPAVIVSPADSALISDAADERRRYLNAFISQLDRSYLQAVMRYNAVLAERNRLLKMQPDETMLQIYDRQLCDHGGVIHARREEFVRRLQPIVAEYYRMLSGDREQVELLYKSELNERPFEEILQAARQKDLVNEFTTSGIHRDDLVLKIGGYPLRKYGSQGQQKSFLIALKLAQYAIVAEEKHERPILLLDDLFDKLDAGRVEQLIRLVSDETFGQILISDCNPTRLKTILDRTGGDYALFAVADGSVTQERMTARQTAEEELRKQETASAAAEPQNPEPESDPRPTEPDDKNAEA
ncbi:DNA replication/repair protein RecF [Alistipes sp.]|uniref:DNA replication/repair protein RecF n=1 Tax=Alistipes sp. TaxID=1872444 RepID=UPI003A8AD7F2